MPVDREALLETLANARAALLAARGPHGHWEGELSSSALSTATAVFALHQTMEGLGDKLDPGAQAYTWVYPLHIGELGGKSHEVLNALLGLALAGFAGSGLWLWWRRTR